MRITRLGDRVSELEATADQPRTPDRARQLLTKLQTLDSDFRTVHLELIDLIDEANTEALDAEQERLDKLDDDVSGLTVRLEALMNPAIRSLHDFIYVLHPITSKVVARTRRLSYIGLFQNSSGHALRGRNASDIAIPVSGH